MSGEPSIKRVKSMERWVAVPCVRAAAKVEIPAGVVGLGLGVAVKKQRDVGGMLRSRLARSDLMISRADF